MSSLSDRLADVQRRIQDATRTSGREPGAVRLIAVSKDQPAEALLALVALGLRDFGENRAQEGLAKWNILHDRTGEWHFLGAVQRNKARFLPGRFSWVHSLDSLALAESLSRHAHQQNQSLRVLLEVNVTEDPRKHGLLLGAVFPFLETYCSRSWPGLTLSGLMTIGPHLDDMSASTRTFASLRTLQEACRLRFDLPFFTELSMGMSDDFPQAIAEGATMVRIGRALFGARESRLGVIKG